MTKKHFVTLAKVIKKENLLAANLVCPPLFELYAQQVLADFCKSQNSRFNRDRWLGYIDGTSGPNGGKVK